ncbi:metallophosphoesterase [Salipiger mucosus]|uniref:Metallophosphoesterase n=1 Tax=Salipiger mucosus DSM 16094 TaxID=1123237 RepID=S9Q4Z5_9RHOB|nr:metallophosphoesterase [Salipiger mucosus]EPX76431.1 metallophosphoesterase [Salipiger mucosus DSM 16094]
MPVLVVADLHLDLWLEHGRDPLAAVSPDIWLRLDALILAGDLTNKPKVRWPIMLRHIGRYMPLDRVHVFPGNHDYYHHVLDGDDRLAELARAEGAHFAQKSEFVIRDHRFLCCTLWTDFRLGGGRAEAMREARGRMNDYRYIRVASDGYRRAKPTDTEHVHANHLSWLSDRLSMPFDGKTIVVTHHCPHPDLVPEPADAVAPAYASDLRALIGEFQPAAWLFGHTHWPGSAVVGRTALRNCSVGYPDEAKGRQDEWFSSGLLEFF